MKLGFRRDKEGERPVPGRLDSAQLDALIIARGVLKRKTKTFRKDILKPKNQQSAFPS